MKIRVILATLLAGMLAAPAMADTLSTVDKMAGHHVVPGHKVEFKTTKGSFTMVLFPKESPKTVANFEKLVTKGFYNGLTFHRVIPGFVVQGGDPKGDGTGGPGWSIPDEHNSLKHIPGAVAMAKAGPDTAGSQFYIALERIPHLDGDYTIFGQVIQGMDVVKKIQPTENGQVKPDRMLKVRLLK